MAEVGHAKMSSVGRSYMSLLESARHDVASAISQNAEVRLFSTGQAKGGRGINANQKRAKQYKAELKRAHAYASELERGNIFVNYPQPCVPARGKHRPTDYHVAPKRGNYKAAAKQSSASPCRQPTSPVTVKNSPEHSIPDPKPFHVKFFRSIINLKICYGCKKIVQRYIQKAAERFNIATFCYRMYKDKYGNNCCTKYLTSTYFHMKLDCVRKIAPRMEISDIVINEEVPGI